jgi:hypothetical protein
VNTNNINNSILYVTDLINVLPGNSSVKTVHHATIEEAVSSVDPTDSPIDWQESDHMICVYCKSMSVPRLYKRVTEFFQGIYRLRVGLAAEAVSSSSTEDYKKSACEDLTCDMKT